MFLRTFPNSTTKYGELAHHHTSFAAALKYKFHHQLKQIISAKSTSTFNKKVMPTQGLSPAVVTSSQLQVPHNGRTASCDCVGGHKVTNARTTSQVSPRKTQCGQNCDNRECPCVDGTLVVNSRCLGSRHQSDQQLLAPQSHLKRKHHISPLRSGTNRKSQKLK